MKQKTIASTDSQGRPIEIRILEDTIQRSFTQEERPLDELTNEGDADLLDFCHYAPSGTDQYTFFPANGISSYNRNPPKNIVEKP